MYGKHDLLHLSFVRFPSLLQVKVGAQGEAAFGANEIIVFPTTLSPIPFPFAQTMDTLNGPALHNYGR